MKRIALLLALVGLLALGGQSIAEQCTIDAVPAATLLLPYFEVDLANAGGVTTLFSVNNASAAPTVAHVTLWTDFSIPTIDFDIFLTGYDVQTVNLRDVFVNGVLPRTADDLGDPDDDISPHSNAAWDGVIPGCGGPGGLLPFNNPAVTGTLLDRIQNGHTGQFTSFDGGCIGYNHGDEIARGYITLDNVNACNLLFPGQPGYFADAGNGFASNVNQLWGDYFYVDIANAFAQGDPLVHIEAFDGVDVAGGAWTDGDYTFYGRYVSESAVDNREPLASVWATRYLNDPTGPFNGGTDLLIWRDSKADLSFTNPVSCNGGAPAWFQLNQAEIIAFDEEENWVELCVTSGQISPPPEIETCIPLETQRVSIGDPGQSPGAPLLPPFEFGWLYLNLNHSFNGVFADIAQSWVTTVMSADGLYSVGFSAIQLSSACSDFNTPLFEIP